MRAARSGFRSCHSASRSKWTRSSPSGADPLSPTLLGFAHRGLHSPRVPENSLAAFRAAAALGAGAECDVRLARDGVPVVFHDADLLRLCGSDARIDQHGSDWLAAQTLLGTTENIPRFAAMLAVWPAELPLLLECKTFGNNAAALAGAVAADLERQPRRAGIMSFDPSVSQWLAAHRPDVPRGLVVDGEWPADFREAAMEHAQPSFLAVDVRLLDAPWVAATRERMPLYSWTIRTREQRAQAAVQADALIWEADGRP